jgi:isopenicillin-N N-acyltransferase-like protein
MRQLRVLALSGTPAQMGAQHGSAYPELIRKFARDRLELAMENAWTGRKMSEREVLSLAEACLDAHHAYSPELTEELAALAKAADIRPAEALITSGFTDFIDLVYNAASQPAQPTLAMDDCTAFLVPHTHTKDGAAMFGQTWDMHATAEEHVVLMRGKPTGAPEFLAFTTVGCLGMIGMNSAGITVGINNLMASDGQVGVSWTHVVRKVLLQDNLEEALACITETKLMGAHNYLLMDERGAGYNVEAMSTVAQVTKLEHTPLVHTNHCLVDTTIQKQRTRPEASQRSSENRLARGRDLLAKGALTPEDLMAVTADEDAICVSSKPPLHISTCGAAIMRPATGDFWAVWGKPTENSYQHFSLRA